jgi:hypothetical protein
VFLFLEATTMTTIEQPLLQESTISPYQLGIDSEVTLQLLQGITSRYIPYADETTNPDLGSKAIYLIDGQSYGSDLGRIAEANVLKEDPQWGTPPEETEVSLAPLEDNSRFFILVDNTDKGPVLVGSLRVADCENGPSETEGFFRESYGDKVMPAELQMPNGREGVWDIVYVVVRPEYQDGESSAWLYYAMHKNSVEEGKKEWVSNISDDEFRRLKYIGIPFRQVVEVEKVPVASRTNPDEVQLFGFYHAQLDEVADSVDNTAAGYEQRGGTASRMGRFALISRFGSFKRPQEHQAFEPVSLAS